MRDEISILRISPADTVRQAIETIDKGARQIALVTDQDNMLLGTVTDGDVRRGLLRGVSLDAPVAEIMRREFSSVTLQQGTDAIGAARKMMQERAFHHVPIVDPQGHLVDLAWIDDLTGITQRDTRVVLMAGGLGTRLRPLTETVPKPMLPVGGRPILEVILQNFTNQGFHKFTLSLNYKGEMIREHFGDGSGFDAQIDYVDETQRMGTAGALSLLPERPDGPFIVMNGDLLTAVRFDSLVRFHEETGATATMCARDYSVQVPYGVIQMEGTRLIDIVEKPTHTHFVNAGIYVLSPEAMDYLEPGTPLDMPVLFERIMADNKVASVFPIREYWIDIGRMEDLERARVEFDTEFQG